MNENFLFDKLSEIRNDLWEDPMDEDGVDTVEAQHRHFLNIIDSIIDALRESMYW